MRYINRLTFILFLVIASGCSQDFDYRISDSIFIEDEENPGLPIYSEKGYNSFGVYWGLTPWTTYNRHNPSKIIVKDDSCHINLSGGINEANCTLVLSIPDYIPDNFTELISLNNKSFDLTETNCALSILLNNMPKDLTILEGEFNIKLAQNLYVDKQLQGVVLSGTFYFKAIIDDEPSTFSNGRFDMRFGKDNFFYMDNIKSSARNSQ